MDPFVGASLISSGASLVSGLFGAKASRNSEDRAFNRSIQLQRLQNDYNRQMWEKQNAYNSPSHQMQMFKDAGINPAARDLGSNIAASEVTASDASVPMNSEYGNIISGIGESLGSGVARTVQALTAEAQIAKLRTDIKYQTLVNRDLQNQLRSNERYMSNVYDADPYQDENGNWVSENYPRTNAYDERRQQGRQDLIDKDLRNRYTQNELEVYQASMPYLKQMSKHQLSNLLQDIRSKSLANDLATEDVKLMKRYGISPNDDGYKSLIRIALRDPDAFNRIIDGLSNAGVHTAEKIINNFRGYGNSHRNPSGSW